MTLAFFFRRPELPESLEWVSMLSPLNHRLFVVEFADAIKQATITGESRELEAMLESWEATAELDAAPEVIAEILRPKTYVSVLDRL